MEIAIGAIGGIVGAFGFIWLVMIRPLNGRLNNSVSKEFCNERHTSVERQLTGLIKSVDDISTDIKTVLMRLSKINGQIE